MATTFDLRVKDQILVSARQKELGSNNDSEMSKSMNYKVMVA